MTRLTEAIAAAVVDIEKLPPEERFAVAGELADIARSLMADGARLRTEAIREIRETSADEHGRPTVTMRELSVRLAVSYRRLWEIAAGTDYQRTKHSRRKQRRRDDVQAYRRLAEPTEEAA